MCRWRSRFCCCPGRWRCCFRRSKSFRRPASKCCRWRPGRCSICRLCLFRRCCSRLCRHCCQAMCRIRSRGCCRLSWHRHSRSHSCRAPDFQGSRPGWCCQPDWWQGRCFRRSRCRRGRSNYWVKGSICRLCLFRWCCSRLCRRCCQAMCRIRSRRCCRFSYRRRSSVFYLGRWGQCQHHAPRSRCCQR